VLGNIKDKDMKKLALIIVAIVATFAFTSCTKSYDCVCTVNGQTTEYPDSNESCEELEAGLIQTKDLPGSGGQTGAYCTQL
jgi:hypothetical protein